jgi:TatD DNase family protein
MILTDTHAHLYVDEFADDISAIMQASFDAGVERIFLPNIDVESIDSLKKLSEKYPKNCFPMMGLHPCSVKENYIENLIQIEKELFANKYIAVGEIGIDLYWDKSFLAQQQQAFITQVNWAKELQLPIVIHNRNSFDACFELMDKLNDDKLKGIFHCFNGTLEQAQKIIDYGGFKLGIGGVLTFKNSGLDEVISSIDLKHLVLETDSPYLAPVPHRGKRNQSAYIRLVAEKLSNIFALPLEEIAAQTTQNSKDVFGI